MNKKAEAAAGVSSPLQTSAPGPSYYAINSSVAPPKAPRRPVEDRPSPRAVTRTLSVTELPRTHSVRLSTRSHRPGRSTARYGTEEDSCSLAVIRDAEEIDGNEVGALRFVNAAGRDKDDLPDEPMLPHAKLARELCLTCLVAAVLLFLCQLVAAGCLCRPVVVLGGLWVAGLLLCKGVLGLRAVKAPTHAMLVGDAVLALLAGVVGVMAAAYLVTGHITVACVSDFHRLDHKTAIRLYVLEFTGLLASLPCIAGAVACFIAAAISAQAARTPKMKPEPPVVLFLRGWADDPVADQTSSSTTGPTNGQPQQLMCTQINQRPNPPTSETYQQQQLEEGGHHRVPTPPPNYHQVAQESYA